MDGHGGLFIFQQLVSVKTMSANNRGGIHAGFQARNPLREIIT
jgi:hypothetical protein